MKRQLTASLLLALPLLLLVGCQKEYSLVGGTWSGTTEMFSNFDYNDDGSFSFTLTEDDNLACIFRADFTFACRGDIRWISGLTDREEKLVELVFGGDIGRITAINKGMYVLEGNRLSWLFAEVVDIEVPEDLDRSKIPNTIAVLNKQSLVAEFLIEWSGDDQISLLGANRDVVLRRTPPQ